MIEEVLEIKTDDDEECIGPYAKVKILINITKPLENMVFLELKILGPWHFDRALIVLKELNGIKNMRKEKFTHVAFWVQIHNIPIMGMERENIQKLGGLIGEVMEVKTDDDDGECIGPYARVRILINITKPLEKMVFLEPKILVPWHFDRALIVLKEPNGIRNMRKEKFTHVAFWVQIHNVPIMGMERENIQKLGGLIGEVMEIKIDDDEKCIGLYARVKILINITKQLEKMVLLEQKILGPREEIRRCKLEVQIPKST